MSKYCAILIETRIFPNLKEIIDSHMKFLPSKDWDFRGYGEDEVVINSEYAYNKLLTSRIFWNEFIDYEKVLIFQTDSEILHYGINEFIGWDYIGSPWSFQQHGGNGGLSLRNPKSMLDCINAYEWDLNYGNEDVFFSNILHRHPNFGKLAPREACKKFACESIFALGTFGAHAINKWLSTQECNLIRNQYKNQK